MPFKLTEMSPRNLLTLYTPADGEEDVGRVLLAHNGASEVHRLTCINMDVVKQLGITVSSKVLSIAEVLQK